MDRLLVVSNRLPVTLKKPSPDSSWHYSMSSGGLVSGLSGLKKMHSFTWIGWPGFEIPSGEHAEIEHTLSEDYSILWPLFHYLPGDMNFDEKMWIAYQESNEAFANVIMKIVQSDDLIWVHDYHLMLLPGLIRKKLSTASHITGVKVGFFLHTPFPSSEIYRVLPIGKEILLGVLSSDLVGFHTYDYARHFSSSCTRILGLSTLPTSVDIDDRKVVIGTFPIGIDPEKFISAITSSPEISQKILSLKKKYSGKKILIGVDRLDYIKGVPHKLHAYEIFFKKYPHFIGKVVLIQVAVPTREDVPEYKELIGSVNKLVGHINGKYGTTEDIPLNFVNKSVTFDELVALYAVADVCIVSSTRDGMNLVSYEYIASQPPHKNGVLILSEFAGAAQSLNGAMIVNPWNTDELAQAYYDALMMPDDIKEANHQKHFRYVTKYTSAYWGLGFVADLKRVGIQQELKHRNRELLPPLSTFPTCVAACSTKPTPCSKIVLFVDYDWAMVESQRTPEFAQPPSSLMDILRQLSAKTQAKNDEANRECGNRSAGKDGGHCPDVMVYVMSGRRRDTLVEWFGSFSGIGLIAEHGAYYRHPNDDGWIECFDSNYEEKSWRDDVRPLLTYYTDRTPGSFIEEKDVLMTWHYRNCDPVFGSWQVAELQLHLEKLLSHMPVKIVQGNKAIELCPSGVDYLVSVKTIISGIGKNMDTVVCIGEDKTSENVFSYLNSISNNTHRDDVLSSTPSSFPLSVFTCAIGKKESEAKYYLDDANSVISLLKSFINQNK